MFYVNFDHYSCMVLFLCNVIIVYCGNASFLFLSSDASTCNEMS